MAVITASNQKKIYFARVSVSSFSRPVHRDPVCLMDKESRTTQLPQNPPPKKTGLKAILSDQSNMIQMSIQCDFKLG